MYAPWVHDDNFLQGVQTLLEAEGLGATACGCGDDEHGQNNLTPQLPQLPQFQYTRLEQLQTQAVDSIARVFDNVPLWLPSLSPPHLVSPARATPLRPTCAASGRVNQVTAGAVMVFYTATPALNLDVLMETGTAETFTFIETMYRLHQRYRLSKFIVLVPTNAIRQGTLKSLQTTAAFFISEYNNQKITVFDYSERTVAVGFVNAPRVGISVLVATFGSFNKQKNVINKRGVEAPTFLARPKATWKRWPPCARCFIDVSHRAEGEKTQEYLPKFNPLLTIWFGATFKNKEYKNLVYALDSAGVSQTLMKGITVDTVGAGQAAMHALVLNRVSGYRPAPAWRTWPTNGPDGKAASVELAKGDNLGEKRRWATCAAMWWRR
ncbi:MAG: DEAD/DEAH box helicase family protein [Paenacidovorax caeni]